MSRTVFDCRVFPGPCSLVAAGTPDEVMEATVQHCIAAHDQTDGPELRELIRSHLKDEKTWLQEQLAAAGE